jgi:hypothetical protein
MDSVNPTLDNEWSQYQTFAKGQQAPGIEKLGGLPASRFALAAALPYLSILHDDTAILREFQRHDPSGCWTAILLGTASFYLTGSGERRRSSQATGVAQAMPGIAGAETSNALLTAARRFLRSQELRVATQSP